MTHDKQTLREEYRQQRRAITDDQHTAWSRAIHEQLDRHLALSTARVVFSYVSCGKEVETVSYLRRLLQRGVRVITPATDRNLSPLPQLHEVHLEADGSLSLPQPVADITIHDINVFLVPGIVWDKRGYRIGFGGGYFDRLLASAPSTATTLGLAFRFQTVDLLPHDPWDVAVHKIISE